MKVNPKLSIAIFLSILLCACGGGGGSGSNGGGGSNNSLTVSGKVTYTKINPVLGVLPRQGYLDYNSPQTLPVRGAVIEVQNLRGNTLSSGNTDANGFYSLGAPANQSVRIIVLAELGKPGSPNTYVADNQSTDAIYGMALDFSTGTSDLTKNLHAEPGWDVRTQFQKYTSARVAAPFAILDTIYSAQQLVLSVDSSVVFPELWVFWSEANDPAADYFTAYLKSFKGKARAILVLGFQDSDTDEYDSHVIAHEWGHYFEDAFSRSDTIGGDHDIERDDLDPRLAFSEGFGNALSAMILNDPIYIDTNGVKQQGLRVAMDLEEDRIPDNIQPNGVSAEASVQEVLYDLFDGVKNSESDNVALGFKPIYQVLIGGHKTTPAFATMFSFLYHLKQANPATTALIDNLANNENIVSAGKDEFGSPAINHIYTAVNQGQLILKDSTSSGNKLDERALYQLSIPSPGCYQLKATATNGNLDLYFTARDFAINSTAPNEEILFWNYTAAGDYALAVEGFSATIAEFDFQFTAANIANCN